MVEWLLRNSIIREMDTDADVLIGWLQEFMPGADGDPMPDSGSQSPKVTSQRETISNFVELPANENCEDTINYGSIALHDAAQDDCHEIFSKILNTAKAAGSSPLQLFLIKDEFGKTPAHVAAIVDNVYVINIMLTSLNEEEAMQLLTCGDLTGRTVLHVAVLDNSLKTVKCIQNHLSGNQLYQLLVEKTESWTVLHCAVFSNYYEIVGLLIEPLNDEQILELVGIKDNDGDTAEEKAAMLGNREVADLLEQKTTTATLIREITSGTIEKQERQGLQSRLIGQPLSSAQLKRLYSYCNQYMIPRIQTNLSQQALIFFNEDDRNGAEEEAVALSESLTIAGCDVVEEVWSEVSQLQNMIANHLLETWDTSSVLILCLMSHGSMGCLQGSDGIISINDILKQVCDYVPPHVPLVLMVQACQASRHGIPPLDHVPSGSLSQITQATDPLVHMSVSDEDMKIDVTRPHTVLLQATVTGRVAYRGVYTGALAEQLKRANGEISIYEMHEEAVMEMETTYASDQSPKMITTLKKKLFLPGPLR